ncbi:IS4 family transposase [Reyranella sp.]|uniref:IS4 family transposase n=1 Tax=Reyranella sp. TaxID=1929291 RepID=UPI00378520CB
MIGEIGYFGNARLALAPTAARAHAPTTTNCLYTQAHRVRAEQVEFLRFLSSKEVTVEEMISHRALLAGVAAVDTTCWQSRTPARSLPAQRRRKHSLGTVGNGTDVGLFIHPVLAVDADNGECLGLVDAQIWRRTTGKAANYKELPIECKESNRWLKGADRAKAVLADAALITVVDDREADIYEKWDRLPDQHTHLLTRACRNRSLGDGRKLFETLASFDEVHRFELDLTARPGKKRIARKATIAVRFGPLTIRRPKSCSDRQASPEIDLFAIEAREIDPPPGQTPIIWRLLTTHRLDSLEKAVTVIGWYRRRWDIEQLFRTLKQQGLRLEQSVLEDGNALEKLAAIALITAAITMQLVAARSADQQATPASRVFSSQQLIVIAALLSTRQGRTAKQRNPFPPNSLAAAAWIIARLGGWTGYHKSNGPITMRDGLERFYAIADGYHLAAQHLCSS